MTSRSSSEPMPLEQKTISRFSISKSKVTRVQAAEEVEFVTELSTANDAQSHGHVQRLAQSPEKKFHGMRKYGVAHDLSTFGTHFNGLTTKRSDSSDYASGSCSEFDSWGKTPGNRELAALKGFRSYPDLTNRQEFGECVKKILVDEVDIKMHRKKLSVPEPDEPNPLEKVDCKVWFSELTYGHLLFNTCPVDVVYPIDDFVRES